VVRLPVVLECSRQTRPRPTTSPASHDDHYTERQTTTPSQAPTANVPTLQTRSAAGLLDSPARSEKPPTQAAGPRTTPAACAFLRSLLVFFSRVARGSLGTSPRGRSRAQRAPVHRLRTAALPSSTVVLVVSRYATLFGHSTRCSSKSRNPPRRKLAEVDHQEFADLTARNGSDLLSAALRERLARGARVRSIYRQARVSMPEFGDVVAGMLAAHARDSSDATSRRGAVHPFGGSVLSPLCRGGNTRRTRRGPRRADRSLTVSPTVATVGCLRCVWMERWRARRVEISRRRPAVNSSCGPELRSGTRRVACPVEVVVALQLLRRAGSSVENRSPRPVRVCVYYSLFLVVFFGLFFLLFGFFNFCYLLFF
jgi:hypothetical protein